MKFEAKVKYEKINPINGKLVTISESYIVENAETFSDAEAQTLKYMAEITPATVIPAIKISDVEDIILDAGYDYFYKARIITTVIDENNGKSKEIPVVLLVQSNELKWAISVCEKWILNCIVDCELVSLSKTKIVDVI